MQRLYQTRFISVTCDVSHLPIFWLKKDADSNIPYIFVILEVFHELMIWLNAEAEANIFFALDTLDKSQLEMSPLNVVKSSNAPSIFVTNPVSHSDIDPYSVSLHEAFTGYSFKHVSMAE